MNPSDRRTPYNAATGSEGASIVGTRPVRHNGPGPEVMAANTLENNAVLSSDGEHLGKIKHIMLDVRAGRIAYAVLSSGGFPTLGKKFLALPWSALTLHTDEKSFVLNVTADRIKDAPGFDKDDWPGTADPQWADTVHTYYDADRYWETDTFPGDEALNRVHQGPML